MNLQLKNIKVRFSHKTVLENFDIFFQENKIHALLGENGAGKSTTANIITGNLIPTFGQIYIDGKKVKFNSPKDAINHDICYVQQRPLLADDLTIKENILLGNKKVDKSELLKLADFWLKNIKLSSIQRNHGGDIKFFTALVATLLKKPKLLILDEPSALLDAEQREFLYTNLKSVCEQGTTIIIITHNMEEALNYSDYIYLLKHGKIEKQFPPKIITKQELSDFLFEKQKVQRYFPKSNVLLNKIFTLKFENVSARPSNQSAIFNLDFHVKQKEITLIKGTPESGLTTLENVITGMSNFSCKGNIQLTQNHYLNLFTWNLKKGITPYILRRKSGIRVGIIPSNKTFRASNPNLSILQMLLPNNSTKSKKHWEEAEKLINKSNINISPDEKSKSLSGGMLQRLILTRELENIPQLLICAEPLQGLDSATAKSFCEELRHFADNGAMIIVLSSSDFPQDICNNIYELEGGYIKSSAENITSDSIYNDIAL